MRRWRMLAADRPWARLVGAMVCCVALTPSPAVYATARPTDVGRTDNPQLSSSIAATRRLDQATPASPATFVSLAMPEGVMVGETLTIDVTCSRPITTADRPWASFRASGFGTVVPIVTSDHITFTANGFAVALPIPADFPIGAFQATVGCAGPEDEVGGSIPPSVASLSQWVIVRPNKRYSEFVSVVPTQAQLGSEVTFTITCSQPPGNAGLIVDYESEVKLVEVNTPDAYKVDGSTFTVTAKIPIDAPVGDYTMDVECDGPSNTFDYFPPPASHRVLTFSVLVNTLPPAL